MCIKKTYVCTYTLFQPLNVFYLQVTASYPDVVGTLSATTHPGARYSPAYWTDPSRQIFYLYGGAEKDGSVCITPARSHDTRRARIRKHKHTYSTRTHEHAHPCAHAHICTHIHQTCPRAHMLALTQASTHTHTHT